MPRKSIKKQKHKSRHRHTRKHNKSPPKEDVAIIKAARSAAGNTLIERSAERVRSAPTQRNMQHFATMLTATMRKAALTAKSYTPSINDKLASIRKGNIHDIFGCGVESALGKTAVSALFKVKVGSKANGEPICELATSTKARNVMLENFKRDQSIKCSNIIPPFQSHANCWFNTMFMCFFVSDKGRKFMRFFRQLMIEGKTSDGKIIHPESLKNSMLLFNAAIEACYNSNGNASSIGLALNTNNIIGNIYNTIGSANASGAKEGIKNVDEYGNPYKFYRDLIKYLGGSKIIVEKIENNKVRQFYSNTHNHGDTPHIAIVTLVDYSDGAQASDFTNKPQKVNYNGATYELDSAIARDISKNHFCCGITCNKTQMVFDGSAFSKLTGKQWKSLINKNHNWSPPGSKETWNFMQGYSMLLYYRVS